MENSKLKQSIEIRSRELGFNAIGFTNLNFNKNIKTNLLNFLNKGFHGDMEWLSKKVFIRSNPKNLWPEANTAIVLGINYGVKKSILKELNLKNTAYISVYARGKDYHQVIKGKLKNLGTYIKSLTSCEIKVFVDTAPIMEKPLAEMAGIGWQGKHTNLVSKRFGSWLF